MEFSKSQPIKVKIYGQEYSVIKPTFALTRDFTRKMKDKKEDEIYEVMCDYLNGLGVPREVVEGMEADHVVSLFEFLTPKKS